MKDRPNPEHAILWVPTRDLHNLTTIQKMAVASRLARKTAEDPYPSGTIIPVAGHGDVTFRRIVIEHGPVFVGNAAASALFKRSQ